MSASQQARRIQNGPEGCTYLDFRSINGAADAERVGDCRTDRNDDDPQGKLGEIMSEQVKKKGGTQ